jgi:hypothetical protein
MLIHEALLAAVQAQFGAALTLTEPAPVAELKLREVGLSVNIQVPGLVIT